MPLQLSNQLKSMIEINKTSSSILRCLINGLIKDHNRRKKQLYNKVVIKINNHCIPCQIKFKNKYGSV